MVATLMARTVAITILAEDAIDFRQDVVVFPFPAALFSAIKEELPHLYFTHFSRLDYLHQSFAPVEHNVIPI